MDYLVQTDFDQTIQDVNLQQIINNNIAILEKSVLLAIAESRSYLIQKYDLDKELSKTGNDRDIQLVSYIVDISLYHLHSRISPRNIPELRVTRYENAIEWLKMCAQGHCTPKLEVILPAQGRRNRFGGNTKNINLY